MCGIAGFFDPIAPETEALPTLNGMLGRIAHRGPDGAGTHHFAKQSVAVGMRRLSIIDLEGGWQPIWNEYRTVAVVFNGEIYNYQELREQLVRNGHHFLTQSDTEVLVHLYEDLGEAMVEKLRGMFAFCIVDLRNGHLFLARDHFGQKPLYYAVEKEGLGRFAFASELKCLLTLPWVKREQAPEAFLDYMTWLSLPAPRTHFAMIHKLPPGHSIVLPLPARRDTPLEPVTTRRYWRYDLAAEATLLEMEEAIEALDRALKESVALHLRADVPLGVLLSSGLDSRTVVTYAQELVQGQMQTFTVGFGDEDSEVIGAAMTAREIKSKHHQLELSPKDFLNTLERVCWHLDEPIGDPACFAVLRVCEMAREHVKVLLSGEGSDELFGGYEGRYQGMLTTLARSEKLRWLSGLLPRFPTGEGSNRLLRLVDRVHHTFGSEALALRVEGFPGDSRNPRGYSPAQREAIYRRMHALAPERVGGQRDELHNLLRLDIEWQLAESLLQKADKMSMAESIELRTPILDRGVAEVAAKIPSALKLPPGGPGKWVLRRTLARKLNESDGRPKKGFPVPLAKWFAESLRDEIESELFSNETAYQSHLDGKRVRAAWDDLLTGKWDGARTIFALWLYERWHRKVVCS